jgi:hypothetical protein
VYAECQERLDEMVRLMRRAAKGEGNTSGNSVDEDGAASQKS